MSNNSTNSSSNNLYNICSLEHCYTNLFALTDITGIKWLRLRAKEKPSNSDTQSYSNLRRKKRKKPKKSEDEEEDDSDSDSESDEDCGDDNDVADSDEQSNEDKKLSSNLIKTTSINDPILITHAKCLNEDILCSWKRIDLPNTSKTLNSSALPEENFEESYIDEKTYKKELWIFWYEKEEPPNLRSLISNDLIVDQSNQNTHNHSNNNQTTNEENILSQAASSLVALPYECRSMLFKALHNLIEKSLIEKGYARLGKWFVMPYNLNSINFSISTENINSSSIFLNNLKNSQKNSKLKPQIQIKNPIDDTNHVSYSFNFFLHGTSRVCTSVDLKLHTPIRYLNHSDLVLLKENLKNYILVKQSHKKAKKSTFLRQNVILAPYGISARLIGYLSNEVLESKLTVNEWKQFYPVNLISELPNVFVVGLNNNRIKLFYPNCFIYVVMDSESDRSDDDDQNFKTLSESFSESNSDESIFNSLDSSSSEDEKPKKNEESQKPTKEMDSLDLTIDSVARNFGAEKDNSPVHPPPNKSILSVSLTSPLSVNAISSPAPGSPSPSPGLQRRGSIISGSPGKTPLKRQKSLLNRSNSNADKPNIKKRKKNFDSSSSDLSLNNSANPTQSPIKKVVPSPRAKVKDDSTDEEPIMACQSVLEREQPKDLECCKYKFNLNKKLHNQIRLKHKKFDLLPENLGLAFDVLDKVNLVSCLNPMCSSNNIGQFTCTRCTIVPKSPGHKCKCATEKDKKESMNVKSEPGLENLNIFNTKPAPFHKRKCYFPHKKGHKISNYKAYRKIFSKFNLTQNYVQLSKPCQFRNANAPTLKTRVLKINRAENDNRVEDNSEHESDCSSDSVRTDPDIFNYQYYEKEEEPRSFESDSESSEESESDLGSTSSDEPEPEREPTRPSITLQRRCLNIVTTKAYHRTSPKQSKSQNEYDLESDSEPSFDNLYLHNEILYEEEPEVNLIPKSSQMTPPKSVESSSQQTVHHHHNQVNVPPISYDDLNNIFEEESSTDEQQNIQNVANQVQLINPIQTGLSVVMTPPSHENIQKTNQTCQDDLLITDPDLQLIKGQILPTKKIIYKDLNSLIHIQNFGSVFSQEKFSIPKLVVNVSLNKYKPIKVAQVQEIHVPKWKLSSEHKTKNDKSQKLERIIEPIELSMPDELDPISKPVKLDIQIKPLDKFITQIDSDKFNKLNLNINKYLNSVCLNLSLSDTLLNIYRDINFDSCTLCVCMNNNIKGLDFSTYLCNDVLNTTENSLNVNNNQNVSTGVSNGPGHYGSCTCGFSAVVNRLVLSKTSKVTRLNELIKIIEKLKLDFQEQNMLIPYFSLVSLLNRLTQTEYQDRQTIVIDSNAYNGLFAEDYSDVLILNQPHYLLWLILQENPKFTLNSALVTKKILNNILVRDGYDWKKSLVPAEIDSKRQPQKNKLNSLDEKLALKIDNKLEDVLKLGVMDIFDLKYSQPMLSTYEQYEIFYQNSHVQEETDELLPNKVRSKLKAFLKHKLDLVTLNQLDENNICRNVLKRLDKKIDVNDSKFLLHDWLYSKKEIKSNLEMTKSLKLIQPILEETVQKKYTTSRMWESFQGPLTWQHFCRLALCNSQQKPTQNQSNASGQNSNQGNQQNNYEPEPIPALLASSIEKDWVTISPYAIKFWDKLNLEPYSKQKNLAYIVIMPEVESTNDQETVLEYETTKQSVKDYFKELNSIYELCRLGLHRPALRIAPEQGFVRVQNHSIKVDEWFNKIQANKQTRQLGKMLKTYAKTLKNLAQKISIGATSTISNTVQGSFFPSETLNNQVKNTTSFQTSQSSIPVVSQINLDRSIYEELKIVKNETANSSQPAQPTPVGSTLSNLLSQPIGTDFTDFNNSLSLEFNSSQSQAQILNFKEEDTKESVFLDAQTQQYQNQQQILNTLASSSNLTQTSQLTQNLQTPPALFIYIIDPFDYKLFNSTDNLTASKKKSENDSDIDDEAEDCCDETLTEFDLRRLRQLGLFKAYLEFYNNLPDLFKFSTQFQIIPLSLCVDIQSQSASLCLQSILMNKKSNSSNYSTLYSAGFGTSWSDSDSDFRQSVLKCQAFNSFCLSKRFFMSPAHNFYLNLHQQQAYPTKAKVFTSFGPAASEEKFLHEALQNTENTIKNFSDLKKIQFYSPMFILAPSTITTTAVSLAASNFFFKNQTNTNHHHANGTGEGISQMPNFIQLNLSNSNYGFLNSNHQYNFNLGDLINQQQTAFGSAPASNYLTCQPYQQQCNVLYVGYCLSDDQRFLLASCCDENGELIESTSINIEVDERYKRRENHARRIGLRKLWEFIIAIISQTSKPWRLVIGRLGRLGHSELRAWACLLSKKNLQRICHQLKDSCESCNIFGNLESPFILSACLISMEVSDSISVYPESSSKEDKIAAAALTGQQSLLSNHAHGVSCTHILTFPASAVIQTQSNSMSGSNMKDLDMGKSALGAMPMEDDIFAEFFNLEEDDELLVENMNDKGLNESGAAMDTDQGNLKEKFESLLNQEELAHLDQQPLAVGYYVSTAKCGPLPKWLRGDASLDTNFHTFKATLHIHNRYALENDELNMKTDNSHKLDSPVTYEALRYVLERYNALSWLNIDPLIQDRKSCLPIHHSILLQMYYAFKNYI